MMSTLRTGALNLPVPSFRRCFLTDRAGLADGRLSPVHLGGVNNHEGLG